MKRRIFKRIFWLYAAVLILSACFTEFYITDAIRERYVGDLKKNLAIQISLISGSIDFSKTNIDSLCREVKEKTGDRVTIIVADGKVIGESDTNSSSMENHRHRPEIEQSLLYDTGSAVRFSNTLRYDFLYVAKRVMTGDNLEGFIRLAVPLKDIDTSVNLFRIRIILIVIMILMATGIFFVWQTDHLRRLLHQITDFSRSLARGEIEKRLFLKDAGEFTEIAENLTAMSEKLQEMINTNEEEKNRLNEILKSVPDALLIIDVRGTILLSSSSARLFFGDVEFTGKQFIEVVRSYECSTLVDEVRKKLSPDMTEFSIDHPEERNLLVRVSPLFYKDKELSGFIVVFHDITQMKKLEQIRKDFVANVSHEIKTPITAIKGFADTLLEGAVGDKENAMRFLQTIKSNAERMNSLADDLMMISKIELGVVRIEKSDVDAEEVMKSVLETLGDKAAEKKLYLRTSVNPRVVKISADRNRLIQILTNLVDNALKFTETGGVTLGIDEEEGSPVLFVEDTGIGIPKKHLPRLGERFYRVDPARSRKMGGTGLGLAIVKHLIKAHGWAMKIESIEGKGTKVKVFLV
jgi:two-component system, OmpR family, phosphate regulon sensor histidine kinase PhoR